MHNDTILIVGHGSREKSGNDEIIRFAQLWRQQRPEWRIEVCFIEFSEVTMSVGLQDAAKDSRRVLVLPLILNAAGHVKMDIPQAINGARAKFPEVEFLYAPHLTACEQLLRIVKRRLKNAMQALDMPDPTTTGVILLGRGSSDRQANGEMAKMARWLMEETDHELVDIAFTGITYPRLEKATQRHHLLGMTQVVVLPYYLFNGTLVERIVRQVEHLKMQYPTIRFISTAYFGFEAEIVEVLEQRVKDLRSAEPAGLMPCDGCKYRSFAEEHGMGGHHHDDTLAHHHDHDHAHDHPHAHPPVPAPIYAAISRTAIKLTTRSKSAPHQHEQHHDHEHHHDHDHAHPTQQSNHESK
jgi:sirohydrochlorin cobaltochelatase